MRLIDADALKEDINNAFLRCLDMQYVKDIIDNAPTIDDLSEYSDKLWQKAYERGKAEAITNEDIKSVINEGFKNGYEMAKAKYERPQGEWIKHIRCIECSVCKNKFFADDENENCQDYEPCTDLRFNFCPNCGADMRGGRE